MKTKHLLFTPVMLLLTVLTTVAQNASDMRPASKDIVPYSRKLPPLPDFTNPANKVLPPIYGSSQNTALLSRLSDFNVKNLKKDPKRFKQQMLEKRNSLKLLSQRQHLPAPSISNRNDQHSGFHLTKDINSLAHSYPSNNSDIQYHQSYAVLNDIIYFAADDGIHGVELWRSDGTEEGTYLVRDIVPGFEGSFPYTITAINGKLYFTTFTPEYGAEPWISDGTESGTQLLKDIKPGPEDGFGAEFIGVGKTVYFAAGSDPFWSSLWKTDGTTEGTVLVEDLGAGGNQMEYITQLTNVNGLLFFTATKYETFTMELWRSDGTNEGTYHVGTNTVFTDFISQLTSYNNHLYFSTSTDSISLKRKLWVSDGTDAGTIPAPGDHKVYLEAEYSYGATFPILNNVLYTTGGLSPNGSTLNSRGLYKYNAFNGQGLVKVKTVIAGNGNGYTIPAEMVVVNNTLYFITVSSNDVTGHDELWESDGDKENTKPVQKFKPGETIYNLYNGYDHLYFVRSNNNLLGTELWTLINTPLNSLAVPVSNVFKGAGSSNPFDLTAFKGKIFFSATDDKKGNELYMTGGTIFSTSLVKDINTTTTADSYAGEFPGTMRALGQVVIFEAYENAYGYELYRSDGTENGTYMLKDIVHGDRSSDPGDFVSKNNFVYFNGFSTDTTVAMFKTNGEKGGLQKITPDYKDDKYGFLNYAVADNGLVFYTMYNRTADTYELWRSDGTSAGNFMLSSTYSFNALHILGNTALFVAGNDINKELWKSDGTVAGTRLVKDINPGPKGSYPGGLFVYNNEVYFGAYDGVNHAFWKSDGTAKGTVEIKNIDPWWGYFPGGTAQLFCISNGILYFSAVDNARGKGTELWKTDGTSKGTQVIKDINPYDNSATEGPFYLTDVNGTLFFTADDGVHGRELWKSDGTKRGTQMVKDIVPGADPDLTFSVLTNLVSYAGKLYFIYNGILWSSDGTEEGTIPVNDKVISKVMAYNVVATSNQLFVSGYTSLYGTELYAGKLDGNTGLVTMSKTENKTGAEATLSFNAMLYPNPVSSNTRLQITGNVKNVSVFITDMNGKQLWQSSNINAMVINLPTEKLASGTYLVTISNGKESKTMKLVKQ